MRTLLLRFTVLSAVMALVSVALADDDPRLVRKDIMQGVRDAAKPVGAMLRGEGDFDAAVVSESLAVFKEAAAQFGDLFPPGTESGEGTEAAPAIWEDRAGFDAKLANWQQAIDTAIAANPATGDELGPAVGPVFQGCKGCHDDYRISED